MQKVKSKIFLGKNW